jgi:hypothetical protein
MDLLKSYLSGGNKMFVLDLLDVIALFVLVLLRLGVPLLGLWLLTTVLKRISPAPVA